MDWHTNAKHNPFVDALKIQKKVRKRKKKHEGLVKLNGGEEAGAIG